MQERWATPVVSAPMGWALCTALAASAVTVSLGGAGISDTAQLAAWAGSEGVPALALAGACLTVGAYLAARDRSARSPLLRHTSATPYVASWAGAFIGIWLAHIIGRADLEPVLVALSGARGVELNGLRIPLTPFFLLTLFGAAGGLGTAQGLRTDLGNGSLGRVLLQGLVWAGAWLTAACALALGVAYVAPGLQAWFGQSAATALVGSAALGGFIGGFAAGVIGESSLRVPTADPALEPPMPV